MEAAGLAVGVVGLAGLFSACVDCFHYIDAGRRYEYDSEILIAKFHIQHVRLYLWGYLVGLTGDIEQENLNILAQQEIGVKLCLGGIRTLLTNSNDLVEKYGLVDTEPIEDDDKQLEDQRGLARVERLRSSLCTLLPNHNMVDSGPDVLARAKWAIRDKGRFVTLVEDLKDFVDGLQGVVPAILPRHNRLVERGISNIDDNEVLQLVLEATDDDYPGRLRDLRLLWPSGQIANCIQNGLKQHRSPWETGRSQV
jgi:Ras family protein A